MRVGMALRSQTLVANAWHHRTDSLSSLVAAIGIGGSWAGVPALDPIAAIVVAGELPTHLYFSPLYWQFARASTVHFFWLHLL